ncbi:hypothetical protein EGW08_020899 [Elysia chlorotica]|uniref:Serpin domain-containing protein n=1 Tax=Elysia chlorotica TaxID=188477 RepID=A0A433SQ17_ELYCH|nr:hypothetical protein EGW08_020899 [Elysia chlorotica]
MESILLTAANNKFALQLFKAIFIEKQEENVFVSPFSIAAALAMTHLGAKDATANGIAEALCWQLGKESDIHEHFRSYLTLLQNHSDKFKLSTASRIFIQEKFKILDQFKTSTKKFYLAEPENADFVHQAEIERQKINRWVSKETEDKIQDLLPGGAVDSLTRMIIVNAIYFKGDWDAQFDERQTQPMPFKLAPGQTKPVPMMCTKKKFAYRENQSLKCKTIEVPYKGKELSMVIILPNQDFGLQDLVASLDRDKLDDLVMGLGPPTGDVILHLPKFEVTSGHSLKEHLSALGMSDAFNTLTADFSGMTGQKDLCISDVIHKAFIKVNEEGTEAAAATAVVMKRKCAVIESPKFVADHPFLYFIKDNRADGLVLFIGAIVNPLL